jgi:hypothetical protein
MLGPNNMYPSFSSDLLPCVHPPPWYRRSALAAQLSMSDRSSAAERSSLGDRSSTGSARLVGAEGVRPSFNGRTLAAVPEITPA